MSSAVENKDSGKSSVSPWTWVPLLFFLQALPNSVVTSLASLALQKLGIEKIAFSAWLGLAGLPWTLKLLWAPLVDLSARKRTWVLITQPALALLIFGVAAAFGAGREAFAIIIALLAVLAVASATHDIAADGYYLLANPPEQQARFVGVLTTAGRIGRLFCDFALLYLVGYLIESKGLLPAGAWGWTFAALGGIFALGAVTNALVLPKVEAPVKSSGELKPHVLRTAAMLLAGLTLYFALAGTVRIIGHALAPYIRDPRVWTQGPTALTVWTWIAIGTAVLLAPTFTLAGRSLRGSQIGAALSTYVTQPKFGSILFFVITYRIGEAMLSFMAKLFFQDSVEKGGLGLDEKSISVIAGFAGVGGIILGGLLGGWFIAKVGLRRAFWPLAIIMHTPNLLFVYAAFVHPPTWQLYPITFVDQFGYGFGFAAYFVYLMQVAQRTPEYRTTHYAIGTGLGALIVSTLAPALSAILQSAFGWKGFFICCCVATIPGMVALLMIPLDEKKPEAATEAGK